MSYDARMNEFEFFARCASGFEKTLSQELKSLGLKRVRPLRGGVAFFGTKADGYRACLWSHVATRIQLVLVRIDAHNADELYRNAAAFTWEDHLAPQATIALEAHGTNQNLRKTTFTALKVKDALCDRMRDKRGSRPNVDAKNPDFAVNIALHEQKATVYLNLAGESLHRRGYREDGTQTEAPLKETLAAGMLLLAQWPMRTAEGGCLLDPMCGSGTLAIEAALMASNTAPGLLRTRWGFEGWAQHDTSTWNDIFAEAQAQREYTAGRPRIVANDLDERTVQIARANAKRAGVDAMIEFHVGDAANMGKALRGLKRNPAPGLLVANPPYGKRLLSPGNLVQPYAALATVAREVPSNWDAAIITPDAGIDTSFGRLPHRATPCFNGPIEASIRQYRLSDVAQTCGIVSLDGKQVEVPVADPNSSQFAARFRKVARDRMRWARKESIDCYRLYDSDLPDYALSIDLYGNMNAHAAEPFVQINELHRPRSADAERAAHHLWDAAALVAAILGMDTCNIVVHAWTDDEQKRSSDSKRLVLVAEDSLVFEVDISKARQTTLTLAQRLVRRWIRANARDKRIACLFATGGSALLHAAAGGAQSTVVADASKEHVKALRRMFEMNGYTDGRHCFATVDVRAWLAQEAKQRHTYDLVICIPPTWLPPKDAGGKEWDAERDCPALIKSATRILAKGGKLVLVCEKNLNLRGISAKDMTQQMTPPDFQRSKQMPHCWVIR